VGPSEVLEALEVLSRDGGPGTAPSVGHWQG
jgi:hypothetical protein